MTKTDTGWKNRIVKHGEMAAKLIVANPYNYKIHTALQDRAVEGSLDTLGWVDDVIINQNTGRLIDGHERVTIAMRRGEDTLVPYKMVDLTEEEELQALATPDPIVGFAHIDSQKLDELLQSFQSDDERVKEILTAIAGKEIHNHETPDTLEDLESEYGEPDGEDFWPVLRVKISPATMEKYDALMTMMPGRDDADKFDALLSNVIYPPE